MIPHPARQLRAYPFACKHCGRPGVIWTPESVPADRVPRGWSRSYDGKPVCSACCWVDLLAIRLLP